METKNYVLTWMNNGPSVTIIRAANDDEAAVQAKRTLMNDKCGSGVLALSIRNAEKRLDELQYVQTISVD